MARTLAAAVVVLDCEAKLPLLSPANVCLVYLGSPCDVYGYPLLLSACFLAFLLLLKLIYALVMPF